MMPSKVGRQVRRFVAVRLERCYTQQARAEMLEAPGVARGAGYSRYVVCHYVDRTP